MQRSSRSTASSACVIFAALVSVVDGRCIDDLPRGAGYNNAECGNLVSGGSCSQTCAAGYTAAANDGGGDYTCDGGVLGGTLLECKPNLCTERVPRGAAYSTECSNLVTDGSCRQTCATGYSATERLIMASGSVGSGLETGGGDLQPDSGHGNGVHALESRHPQRRLPHGRAQAAVLTAPFAEEELDPESERDVADLGVYTCLGGRFAGSVLACEPTPTPTPTAPACSDGFVCTWLTADARAGDTVLHVESYDGFTVGDEVGIGAGGVDLVPNDNFDGFEPHFIASFGVTAGSIVLQSGVREDHGAQSVVYQLTAAVCADPEACAALDASDVTLTPANTDTDTNRDSRIAGIVFGCLVFACILCIALWMHYVKHRPAAIASPTAIRVVPSHYSRAGSGKSSSSGKSRGSSNKVHPVQLASTPTAAGPYSTYAANPRMVVGCGKLPRTPPGAEDFEEEVDLELEPWRAAVFEQGAGARIGTTRTDRFHWATEATAATEACAGHEGGGSNLARVLQPSSCSTLAGEASILSNDGAPLTLHLVQTGSKLIVHHSSGNSVTDDEAAPLIGAKGAAAAACAALETPQQLTTPMPPRTQAAPPAHMTRFSKAVGIGLNLSAFPERGRHGNAHA